MRKTIPRPAGEPLLTSRRCRLLITGYLGWGKLRQLFRRQLSLGLRGRASDRLLLRFGNERGITQCVGHAPQVSGCEWSPRRAEWFARRRQPGHLSSPCTFAADGQSAGIPKGVPDGDALDWIRFPALHAALSFPPWATPNSPCNACVRKHAYRYMLSGSHLNQPLVRAVSLGKLRERSQHCLHTVYRLYQSRACISHARLRFLDPDWLSPQ